MGRQHRILRADCISALGVFVALGCSVHPDDVDNREDLTVTVISCEEAYARLEECCPGFDGAATGGCVDHDFRETRGGCLYDDTYDVTTFREHPSLSLDESRCIRGRACSDLIANGICDRAQKAGRRRKGKEISNENPSSDVFGPTVTTPIDEDHPPVCP